MRRIANSAHSHVGYYHAFIHTLCIRHMYIRYQCDYIRMRARFVYNAQRARITLHLLTLSRNGT